MYARRCVRIAQLGARQLRRGMASTGSSSGSGSGVGDIPSSSASSAPANVVPPRDKPSNSVQDALAEIQALADSETAKLEAVEDNMNSEVQGLVGEYEEKQQQRINGQHRNGQQVPKETTEAHLRSSDAPKSLASQPTRKPFVYEPSNDTAQNADHAVSSNDDGYTSDEVLELVGDDGAVDPAWYKDYQAPGADYESEAQRRTNEQDAAADEEEYMRLFGVENSFAKSGQWDHLPPLKPLSSLPPNFSEVDYAGALVNGRGLHKPFLHDAPYRYPVAQLAFSSHEPTALTLFTHLAEHSASALGIPISTTYALPTKRRMWTVLKSPFVYKTTQENFERKTYRRGILAWDADEEVVHRWITYLMKRSIGGVGMRVVKWQRYALSAQPVEDSSPAVRGEQTAIKEAAEKIVTEETAAQSQAAEL